MSYPSTTDHRFLAVLQEWLQRQREILILIRFSRAAGSKSFEFFSLPEMLHARLQSLMPGTCVTAFKQPQLLLRGVVDDDFITTCLNTIPDGVEFLVKETESRTYGSASWYHHSNGDSHTELREELEDSRRCHVAVGRYPPWLIDTDDVISAVVPDEYGIVTTGIY